MFPPKISRWLWVGCAVAGIALQSDAAPLENNDAQGVKRVNETLTRAGFPAIQVGDGPASVSVALSPGASANVSGDQVRSPLSATSATALGKLNEERVADARGITEKQVEELREDRGVSFLDILMMPSDSLRQAIFEQEREAGDHPEEAMRYEESFKVSEGGRKPTPADIERARRQAQALPLDTALLPAKVTEARKTGSRLSPQSVTSSSWTWKGPGNIGGRIRTMVIHPTQTNRMWIGSVGGGIWYSSNSGASWSPVNDFMSNLAVSTLAMDPTNSNTMYAGTGEGFYNADGIRGAGIYKSTDAGVTWTQLASTANNNFLYVQSIAISPDGTTLLAATSTDIFGANYIYRSTDGGTTWVVANTPTSRISHVEFNPNDSAKAIASGYSHLALYSTDTGASWTLVATGPTGGTGYSNGSTTGGGRVEARYARSNPSIVYAAYDFGSASYLYKSTDGGVTYATVNTTGTWLTTQGWYANAIWISPVDPNVIVVGGLDIYRSTNGGTSFTKISNWQNAPTSAHADHHGIFSDPGYNGSGNNLLYFTNDGGIYKATNVSTVTQTSGWTALNNQLGITQFYGAGLNASTGTIVAGAQDNGTLTYTTAGGPQAWTAMFGGDGGYAAADQSNSSYFYGEYVYLDIHRSSNGGGAGSGAYIYTGISDANSGSTAEFIAPFILDPNNQATLLGGGLSLWRTTNARASSVSWSAIKSSVGSTITAIAVAPGNSDQIWVGHRSGAIYKTINGTAATPTWTLVNSGLPARRVTRLVVDPNNLSHVYACFGGYSAGNLWSTTNAGTNWTNVTGNLPFAPIYGVAIYPGTSQTLCAGTDVGVFASSDGGATWAGTNVGPTLASTQEIFFSGSNLVAVTHGRGVFTAPISQVDSTPPVLTITPSDSSPTDVSPIVFNLNWSENVTGFDATDLQVQGGSVASFSGSGAAYVATVTPSANPGTVTLSVAAGAALDYASNASVAASSSVGYNSQSPYLYANSFDGATAPAGWLTAGDWQWGVPTSGPGVDHTSGSGKLFGTVLAGNYSNSASEYLTTPPFTLPSTGLPYKFRFWMWLNSDNGADGGNLEISSNGGAFGVVPNSLLSIPYNTSSLTSMVGGLGWTGTTFAAWTKVRADLSSYAGATVQLRFHFTSDANVNFAGWYIDDAAVELDPITVTLNATDPTATTGSNTGSVAVSLSAPAPVQLSVGYTTGGTAVASRDYTLAPSGAVTISPGSQSAVITVNPITGGSRSTRTETVILALANSGTVGVNAGTPNTATVYLAGSVGYDAWRASHFTDSEFADASISGQNADPDGDGISNILEYALGLNPKQADNGGLPQPVIVNVAGQNYLSITIARPSSDTDVTYVGQVSGDLQTWDGSFSAVSTTVQANTPAGYDTVTFRDLTPLGGTTGTKRFLRLNVTQN